MKKIMIAGYLATAIGFIGCSENKDSSAPQAPVSIAPPTPSADKLHALMPTLPQAFDGKAVEQGGDCNIGAVNKHPLKMPAQEPIVTLKKADNLELAGRAFDTKVGTAPTTVALQLMRDKVSYYTILNRQANRQDLVKAFGNPEYAKAGLTGSISLANLPAGQYDAFVLQLSVDKNIVCSTHRKFNIID